MIKYLWRHPVDVVHYLSYRIFLLVVQALPLEAALPYAEFWARRMVHWTRRDFRQATKNLQAAYPRMTEGEARRVACRVYEHFSRAVVEMAVAHRLLRPATVPNHVALRGTDVVRQVQAAGKGAIFVTAHLGVWEMFGLLMRDWGIKLVSVYRPARNPLMDRIIRRWRKSLGHTLVERDGAMPKLLRTLRRGGYIALLTDQHAKRDGVWVPFFGRPASTTPAPALLALRTGAPIVTGYVRRLPGHYKFEAFLDEPIWAQPSGDRDADVRRITEEISRRLERYIRLAPEQWLWMHRRWREVPPEVAESAGAALLAPEVGDQSACCAKS